MQTIKKKLTQLPRYQALADLELNSKKKYIKMCTQMNNDILGAYKSKLDDFKTQTNKGNI